MIHISGSLDIIAHFMSLHEKFDEHETLYL